ncbi:hypothetical protein BJ741DRAFT_593670 [Chytriomyces cf. hyalinus JEL632]|nr:hypothetical protein BJ741DRAFT_593670 [Chytriomyces cf. hyalinus JEL632]
MDKRNSDGNCEAVRASFIPPFFETAMASHSNFASSRMLPSILHPLLQPPTTTLAFDITPLDPQDVETLAPSPQAIKDSSTAPLDHLPISAHESPSSSRPIQAPPIKPKQPPHSSNTPKQRPPTSRTHVKNTTKPVKKRKLLASPVAVPDPTIPKPPPLPKGKFFQNGVIIHPPPQPGFNANNQSPLDSLLDRRGTDFQPVPLHIHPSRAFDATPMSAPISRAAESEDQQHSHRDKRKRRLSAS